MTRYRQGVRAEYRVRDHFRALGYYVVRSAGSKGVADLVALGPKGTLLVQVKRTAGRAWRDANVEKLAALPVREAQKVVVVVRPRSRDLEFFWL